MKRLAICFAFMQVAYFSTPFLYADESIEPENAHKFIGQSKTVCGKVANTWYGEKFEGKPTYLNLDKPWPHQIFSIVIWGANRDKFNIPPEELYREKHICVTGKIGSYNEIPRIIVNDPELIN